MTLPVATGIERDLTNNKAFSLLHEKNKGEGELASKGYQKYWWLFVIPLKQKFQITYKFQFLFHSLIVTVLTEIAIGLHVVEFFTFDKTLQELNCLQNSPETDSGWTTDEPDVRSRKGQCAASKLPL